MNTYGERKFLICVLFVLFGWLVCFCGFYILFAGNVLAQSGVAKSDNVVIKIPPKIKVLDKDYENKKSLPKLQTSDIKILTSKGKALVFRVELARTDDQRRMGLMFRSVVAPGTGMLFLFNNVQERTFWMKNTWIPLDIIFIREDGVIHNIHHSAQPNSLEHISSDGDVQHVLEIGGGEAKRLGIFVGDKVLFD